MSKAGRKRNAMAKRQPDGSIRTYEDPMAAAIARRVRDRLYSDARHEWYGFPLGKLYALKAITLEEFTAGKAWAANYWRLAQMDGLMLPMCKAIDWSGAQGRKLAAEPTEQEIETIKRLRRKMAELEAVIRITAPKAYEIMARLCIGDCELVPSEEAVAKKVLVRIAALQKAGA